MGGQTKDNEKLISATNFDGVADGVGQGKLYSPDHAIKVATNSDENVSQGTLYSPDHAIKIAKKISEEPKLHSKEEEEEKQKNMIGPKNLAAVKDRVLEKLAAAAIPSESLENAKQVLEGVVKDFAGSAQGMKKDALHRIKSHLADILPSVSPALTGKMVDDAEKEATKGENEDERNLRNSKESSTGEFARKPPYISPTSSFFGSVTKPFSRI